jgi:L,D-peptidoglycan transpeptidase YkuD (ErfK/YbiS/YcfS/YnhG family)
MKDIRVLSPDTLTFQTQTFRCAIGKNGFTQGERKEGSLTTPQGRFALRECWYRADRVHVPPATALPQRVINQDDGWCDDATHPLYNRPVRLPFAASHEKLWREDGMYDIIVPLGFNDNPVIAGRGSAIFLHIAKPDYSPTEGCVALALEDMQTLLAALAPEAHILIAPKI